jgi:hypothetical protein
MPEVCSLRRRDLRRCPPVSPLRVFQPASTNELATRRTEPLRCLRLASGGCQLGLPSSRQMNDVAQGPFRCCVKRSSVSGKRGRCCRSQFFWEARSLLFLSTTNASKIQNEVLCYRYCRPWQPGCRSEHAVSASPQSRSSKLTSATAISPSCQLAPLCASLPAPLLAVELRTSQLRSNSFAHKLT